MRYPPNRPDEPPDRNLENIKELRLSQERNHIKEQEKRKQQIVESS
jgi:hypothetical protein